MKVFNLSQTRAEVAEQIVDAQLSFLNKSGYTKNFWLVWNSAELSIQYHSEDSDDHLIRTIYEWGLGDTCDLSGAALRSALIKTFVHGDFELPDQVELDDIGTVYFSYLDDRWTVYKTNGGWRFKPADPTVDYSGVYSDWFKNKSDAIKAALDWDYQTGQIGLIEE